jgi:hypothetical protein
MHFLNDRRTGADGARPPIERKRKGSRGVNGPCGSRPSILAASSREGGE